MSVTEVAARFKVSRSALSRAINKVVRGVVALRCKASLDRAAKEKCLAHANQLLNILNSSSWHTVILSDGKTLTVAFVFNRRDNLRISCGHVAWAVGCLNYESPSTRLVAPNGMAIPTICFPTGYILIRAG